MPNLDLWDEATIVEDGASTVGSATSARSVEEVTSASMGGSAVYVCVKIAEAAPSACTGGSATTARLVEEVAFASASTGGGAEDFEEFLGSREQQIHKRRSPDP